MAPAKGNLTANMAVLGLIIKRPDNAAHVRVRLDQEYPHEQWSRSIAYNNIKDLAEKGWISKVSTGPQKSEDIYEPTDEGLSEFKRWAAEAAKAPPASRDGLMRWLEHADESELPEMVAVLRALEDIASTERDATQLQLNQERRRGVFGPADGSDFRGLMRYTVQSLRVTTLTNRASQLKQIALNIQKKGRLQLEEPDPDDG
jgi:DNA-binding PadR family transcriptional regulator